MKKTARDNPTRPNKTAAMRIQIAQEAARLISEHGIRDYAHAKRKAAERFHISDQGLLPSNMEIAQALRENQSLFFGEKQQTALQKRRQMAIDAMQFLARFEPRLVGAVLDGSADEHSAICLHLFADHSNEVQIALANNRIPFELTDRRLKFSSEQFVVFPVIQMALDKVGFDLTIFSRDDIRQAPLDRVTNKPIQRANIELIKRLVSL